MRIEETKWYKEETAAAMNQSSGRRKPVPDDVIDKIKALSSTHTLTDIGKVINKPASCVYRLAKAHNIKVKTNGNPRATTSEEDADIKRRYANCQTIKTISEAYPHLNYHVIWKRVHL